MVCFWVLWSIQYLVSATVKINRGIALSLIQIPPPSLTHAAPAKTKFPVTCAVKNQIMQ